VAWLQRCLALQGDEPAQRWAAIIKAMERLQTMDKLPPDQFPWLAEAGERLAELRATKPAPLTPVVAVPPITTSGPSSPR
jgi:hypothetical protein